MDLRKIRDELKLNRRKKNIPVDKLEPVKCANCGHEFKGHFCPDCGQEVAEFNRPFGFVIYDFVGNFFAFDTRFFRTFKYLLFRPGFLTVEFFEGRRVRYSPPFRIFVFLSFILFLFLQALSERTLDYEPELKQTDPDGKIIVDATINAPSAKQKIDSLRLVFVGSNDTIHFSGENNADSIGSEIALNLGAVILGKGNLRTRLNKLANLLEAKFDKTTDPKEKMKLGTYIAMCRAPEMVISTIMKYLSWAFFILLPLFALILKLFYIRRNQLYIKHLIFSIHLHSYLFFILVVVTGLMLLFSSGWSTLYAILLFTFPVYFVLALHHFYRQNFPKVVLKFIGVSIIYNLMLWSAVIYVFLKSIQII